MISNLYLTIFALAMAGCVLTTPLVTFIASWVGAIDRPDQFRRIHHGAIPRLGGLALAVGVGAGIIFTVLHEPFKLQTASEFRPHQNWPVLIAGLIILAVGFTDDIRSLSPRMKLLGQAAAVLVLYFGGIRINSIEILSLNVDLGFPVTHVSIFGFPATLALPSLLVTVFWFLGCMNVWNLIDGMDGLASGVGLLVSGTLTLVAIHNENYDVAVTAVALAGSLAGFLLYNWHPACIFLGDSGALLIGLLIGVIGVEGSMEGPSAISIVFPILAMGLPISDTVMAIFRRWVRNLPFSTADRRHVHHLLIGLGLNPRQVALMLYCFSSFLCGAVMLGVALRNEYFAIVLGSSGCLVFLLVVTSRRNELNSLCSDLQDRIKRKRQERQVAKLVWEAVQRIELCTSSQAAYQIVDQTARALGCDFVQFKSDREATFLPDHVQYTPWESLPSELVSGPSITFRLSRYQGWSLTATLGLAANSLPSADIVLRYLERMFLALTDKLDRLQLSATSLDSEADRSQFRSVLVFLLPAPDASA